LTICKRLRVSAPAKADLAHIGDHTRRVWGAAQKHKYLGLIKDKFNALRRMPGLGASRNDIAAGLRALMAERHIIFYRETQTELEIVRVLHGNMDVEALREGVLSVEL